MGLEERTKSARTPWFTATLKLNSELAQDKQEVDKKSKENILKMTTKFQFCTLRGFFCT